ncbi:MAG: methyltransferase [Candidatus Aenigmarchaeota archaeon]|nr:methyltransferase [Candidatus Aenigmarchaeota archaeon]
MKYRKIREGKVEIFIPDINKYQAPVFYNPDAEFLRDISVAVLSIFKEKIKEKINVLDALSASGISGIRYKKEVGNLNLTLNDKNKDAVSLIRKNIKHNNINAEICNEDANLLMRKRLFDFIDIDPFGSPCVYMDSVAHSIKFNRLLAVTATDTGALSGSFPNACLRKYGIRATKKQYYKETGVRVLITFIMNSLARYNKSFKPILYLSHKHYYRIYGIVQGSMHLTRQLKKYKYVDGIGTIYLGEIKDNDFIKKIIDKIREFNFTQSKKEIDLLNKILEEIDEPFYYDLNKMHIIKVPKVDDIIFKLIKRGYKASRTSLCGSGIKTNAKLKIKNGLLIVEK